MQPRLALTAAKLNKLVTSTTRNKYLPHRSLATSGGAEGRTADPDVHATDPGDTYPEERPLHTPTKEQPHAKENDPFVAPKQPHSPSSKLESNPVNQPSDPIKQQRRRYSEEAVKDPEDEMDRRTQIRERVKDDQEYFKHHKASPLSEIEIVDTRKPLTQATDGTGGGYFGGDFGGGDGGEVVHESAEETLIRAHRMFWERARRGDPDSPHGRVLRELRGEYW